MKSGLIVRFSDNCLSGVHQRLKSIFYDFDLSIIDVLRVTFVTFVPVGDAVVAEQDWRHSECYYTYM